MRSVDHALRLVAVALNVVNGEVANGVDVLGVEQQEQARDPVNGQLGVIVQEPTCDLSPPVLIVRAARAPTG